MVSYNCRRSKTSGKMGSGVSMQVSGGAAHLHQMGEAERKLAEKFPKFRDIKFKKTDFSQRETQYGPSSQDSITGGHSNSYLADVKQDLRGGIYSTVYSYYHWKNYKNKYNTLTPVNSTKQ